MLKIYLFLILNLKINSFNELEFRDYIIAISLLVSIFSFLLSCWNFFDSRRKFAALNFPILKAELELAPHGTFPVYPSYKVSNISDKKAIDVHVTVKIACLGHKWKFWRNKWINRACAKIEKLEPKEVLKFPGYQNEYFYFLLSKANEKIADYFQQKYLENVPFKALITVSYKPLIYEATTIKISKEYKIFLRRSRQKDFFRENLIFLMPTLLKLEEKLCLFLIHQCFVYRNLLPRLELYEMSRYCTHYWEIQELEQTKQLLFRIP